VNQQMQEIAKKQKKKRRIQNETRKALQPVKNRLILNWRDRPSEQVEREIAAKWIIRKPARNRKNKETKSTLKNRNTNTSVNELESGNKGIVPVRSFDDRSLFEQYKFDSSASKQKSKTKTSTTLQRAKFNNSNKR
jgi:hypothetical protein